MAFRPAAEDDLAELKCIVLESMREILVKNVDPTKFLPFLRSRFVLDGRESAIIKSCCSKSVYDGADKLIDVLCTKGAKGFDAFCDAIVHDKTQVFLLTAINKRLELIKHTIREQEMERARIASQQRITLEQIRHQEVSGVRHYQPTHPARPGGVSAHTTTCLNHVPLHGPQHPLGMSSRSPNTPTDQQYPTTEPPYLPAPGNTPDYPQCLENPSLSEWNGVPTSHVHC